MNSSAPYLLDTHVWLWLMNGDALLKKKTLDLIQKASLRGLLRVSAISVWEVAMLESRGRITLSMTCMDWVTQSLNAPGISLLPLTPEISVDSTRLPGQFHGDPADQILVATARKYGAVLLTRDQGILQYGDQEYVKTMEI